MGVLYLLSYIGMILALYSVLDSVSKGGEKSIIIGTRMLIVLHILALIPLCIIIYFLGNFLWHSFRTQVKGLPPYINTYYTHRSLIRNNLHLKPGSSILDLGCGDGTMLRLFTKWFRLGKAVGYDINTFAIRFGRWLNKIHGMKNIELINDDLYNADVTGFDYIYLYLYPDFVENMEDWLFERIDEGTIVICNTFDFAKHKPFEIIRSKRGRKVLFLYKK